MSNNQDVVTENEIERILTGNTWFIHHANELCRGKAFEDVTKLLRYIDKLEGQVADLEHENHLLKEKSKSGKFLKWIS